MPGDDGYGRGQVAVGDRDPRTQGSGESGGDPGDDLERYAFPCQELGFFAAPAQQERVAPFEPDDLPAFP